MPHECTTCRRVFPDGSKEMLSGCPDCGGNKFQFRPAGSTGDDGGAASGDGPAEEPPEPPEPQTPGGVAETVAGATERVRNLVGSDDHEWPAVGREDGQAAGGAAADATEDTAQASARTSVVERDELPDPPEQPPRTSDPADDERQEVPGDDTGAAPTEQPDAADGEAEPAAGDDPGTTPFTGNGDRREESPDLSELRDELNDQFESIRIVDRGQYELNLMELYDREEYIISLLEDGRYAIEVPETWRGD